MNPTDQNEIPCNPPLPHNPYFPRPSKFRYKKGYTGKTAQKYNKNVKKMPKGF